MTGVSYGLVDFVTGGPIIDVPVMQKAPWSAQLNRPDSVSCKIDLRDPAARKLDLRASSEPMKTLLIARTDDDVVLAWGLIEDDGRTFDEDSMTLSLTAHGIGSSYFGQTPIAPASARTAPLTVTGPEGFAIPNPALDTSYSGLSHGTIMKRLIQQQLAWPGAPTVFDLPPDELGTRTETWAFSEMKTIGKALEDIMRQEVGPDFAFEAQRASNGLGLRYIFRHGSEAQPRLGTDVGVWSIGGQASPITELKITDAVTAGASMGWMVAGRSSGVVLLSRVYDATPIANGYPPFAIIDTTRSDVKEQDTLDSYNAANMEDAKTPIQDLEFTVEGDASPGLGQYRPGDTVTLDPPENHPWHTGPIPIRIMSMSGDETGKKIKIGCVILDGP